MPVPLLSPSMDVRWSFPLRPCAGSRESCAKTWALPGPRSDVTPEIVAPARFCSTVNQSARAWWQRHKRRIARSPPSKAWPSARSPARDCNNRFCNTEPRNAGRVPRECWFLRRLCSIVIPNQMRPRSWMQLAACSAVAPAIERSSLRFSTQAKMRRRWSFRLQATRLASG